MVLGGFIYDDDLVYICLVQSLKAFVMLLRIGKR